MPITIKSPREIELMTEAGRILEIVHDELAKALRPGMTTKDIDRLGEEVIRSYGCVPSFLGYNGYPASICVSVNEEVVHGIPSDKRIIKEGDIVGLDAGVIYKGYHSDAARTHAIGEVSKEAKESAAKTIQAYISEINAQISGESFPNVTASVKSAQSINSGQPGLYSGAATIAARILSAVAPLR